MGMHIINRVETKRMRMRRAVWALCALSAALVVLASVTAPARADFGFAPGSTAVALSTQQAGAHPDITTSFKVNRLGNGVDGDVHSFRVSLPPGIIGAVRDLPTCTEDQLQLATGCPVEAQVGVVELTVVIVSVGFEVTQPLPVYNMVPAPGASAQFGFQAFIADQPITVTVRSDDYGLDTVAAPIMNEGNIAAVGASVTLWGVPADPSHDPERYDTSNGTPTWGVHSLALPRAMLTNPSTCDSPSTATLTADSWEHQGDFVTDKLPIPAFTGCERLPDIAPIATISPNSLAVGQPSGYGVDINVPQADNPYGIATPPAKTIDVTLPAGTAISPGAADGLAVCKDEQIRFGSSSPVTCPDASKVGSVSIDTPALKDPLTGSMYLRESSDAHLFRLVLVAEGPGVVLKLPGDVTVDPKTGQVTTHFDDSPQFPFTNLHVQLKGGSRALLANPPSCGSYTSTVSLTPYGGGAPGVATSDFSLSADGHGAACPSSMPFAPGLSAGVLSPVAGASSPFVFRLTRSDADREIGAISSVHLPPGLLADVRGVPLCSDTAAATATCPPTTRIGSVQVGSGPGDKPLYLPGTVYLTGPYKGAPFGLSIVVDAITGPYDLGTVNVRAAVQVNRDATLSVVSDPLPTMLQGIPLRLRDIRLSFDRPGFMINPTSCAPTSIVGTVTSVDGATAPIADRFQVGDCASLGFRPRLSLALGGRGKSGTTSLVAHLVTRTGDAHPRRISVELPTGVGLNVNNGKGLCSSKEFEARSCPADSIVGHASVESILHVPLSGPVYFVQGAGGASGALPRLFIPLEGEGVTIDLVAQSSLKNNRIVTTFDGVPDVPYSTFDLKIDGGPNGILALDRASCRSTLTSPVEMDAYNGRLSDSDVVVSAGCPLSVISQNVGRARVTLRLSGIGAGVLRVSGAGIRSTARRVANATVASITAPRTPGRVLGRVKVSFDPAGAAGSRSIVVKLAS